MKKKILSAVATLYFVSASLSAIAWGVWAHEHTSKAAILALPKEMAPFFYNHGDFIVCESTVPDVRKHLYDKSEGPRHFIDLEWFNFKSGSDRPVTISEAIARYGKDSLDKYGILPWHIQDIMAKLTDAFKNRRKTEILFLAADLGHYVADAHMPLHTSINHDGQLTGQVGIHAFWESQLPELFGKNYNLYTSDARYIKNVSKTTWDIIDSTHSLVNTMLRIEAKMKKDNPEDKQYVMDQNGRPKQNKFGQPIHAYEYAHVYHELLNSMVERQMKSTVAFISDFWYTAWVNAGKPDMAGMDPDYVTERNNASYQEDLKAWKKGKVRGLRSDKEF